MNRSNILIEGQAYYQMNKRRIWTIGAIILVLAIIFSVGFITKTVTAQRISERAKYVTSIGGQKRRLLMEYCQPIHKRRIHRYEPIHRRD